MKTSIIILTYNNIEYTKECIDSIRMHTKEGTYEIIVIDNLSIDNTRTWLLEQNDLKVVLNSENLGFPKGCNIGIGASEKENDILLLNNDTIVTDGWLENLQRCLYKDELIGAVGPVSNSVQYYQQIDTKYKDCNEMKMFAKKFNKANENLWEERQKLIGFCMLIKRSVLDEVGLLDERFTPGNYEDDDYSIRIIERGYKIYLCKDTFIHHYGGVSFSKNDDYMNLLNKNENEFKLKWGFTSKKNMNIYKKYEDLIQGDEPVILELSCGTGATALYLKQKKECDYYGYDMNKCALSISSGNINHIELSVLEKNNVIDKRVYDYIILSDFSEFSELEKALINNLETETRLIFNLKANENNEETINKIISAIGVDKYLVSDGIQEKNLINSMEDRYYLVFTNKHYDDILKYIAKINSNNRIEENLSIIRNYICEDNNIFKSVIRAIKLNGENKVDLLNTLGLLGYKNRVLNCVEAFKEALEYDESNYTILMNYSELLYEVGEYDLALLKMNSIENKDSHWYEMFNKINNKKSFIREIKFLLRRIEFDIEIEETTNKIIDLIKGNKIQENLIIDIVNRDIINKVYVLNYLVVQAIDNGIYDILIPLLNRAYDINPEELDTNYNLCYVLNAVGEKQMALDYLSKLKYLNSELEDLKVLIEDDINE